jgi:hypothetical protein
VLEKVGLNAQACSVFEMIAKRRSRISGEADREIRLESVSPVVFMLVKVGQLAQVRQQMAKKNEYREKIPRVAESLLVFIGNTKIGMIPGDIVLTRGAESLIGKCRIVRMSKEDNVVGVRLLR